MAKKPFHETVAEDLIKQLEEGTAPWQRPWDKEAVLPLNPTTGKRYKGINAVHLMSQDREDPRWMTYKQAQSEGAQVQKGETSTSIQYWKFNEEKTKINNTTGKPVRDDSNKIVKESVRLKNPRVFYANVFNAEQIKGLPLLERKDHQWDAIEQAEIILKGSGANINHDGKDRAFYRESTDSIHLPKKERFDAPDKYYATALHELGHWTGHNSRLDREMGNIFGSESYAKEELRAEISSMLVGTTLGIGHDPSQHVSYVKSWIKALQDDPKEIFRASADAEKIHDFVMSFEKEKTSAKEELKAKTPKNDALVSIRDKLERDNLTKEQKEIVMARIQENIGKNNQLKSREEPKQKEVEQER